MILTHNITKLQLSAVSPDQVEGICTKECNAVIFFGTLLFINQSTLCPRFLKANASYACIYIILPTYLIYSLSFISPR